MNMTICHPFEKDVEDEIFVSNCVVCDGTGEIDQETADMVEFERNMWCECEKQKKKHYTVFYEDGEHPEIYKHHYRCPFCDGVVQIG